jgi:hypothetical protein
MIIVEHLMVTMTAGAHPGSSPCIRNRQSNFPQAAIDACLAPVACRHCVICNLNHMAGRKPGNVFRPVSGIRRDLMEFAFRIVRSVIGSVLGLRGYSAKAMVPPVRNDAGGTSEKPPRRW